MSKEELGVESVIQHVQTRPAVHCVEDLFGTVAANLMAIEALYEAADRAVRGLSMNVAAALAGDACASLKAPGARMIGNMDKAGIMTAGAWRQSHPVHPDFSKLGVNEADSRLYGEGDDIYLVLRISTETREVDGYMQSYALSEAVEKCYGDLGAALGRARAGIYERPQLHVHREAGITRISASTLAGRKIWPEKKKKEKEDGQAG